MPAWLVVTAKLRDRDAFMACGYDKIRSFSLTYGFLMQKGCIPDSWFGAQVTQADRIDGDIDTLSARIAQIRTWTFVGMVEPGSCSVFLQFARICGGQAPSGRLGGHRHSACRRMNRV